MSSRYYCTRCREICTEDDTLTAKNPFDGDTMLGCPLCKSADPFVRACDVPECKHQASGGTPTKDGYRWTCHEHRPEK